MTYGHVSANRMVINELNVQIATLNKTMMAVIGETKFIKFTVAALTDMRMTLAQLSLGLMSLQENVNAIYEYMRVLSTRRVNPLIIPPESLRMVLTQAKEDMKRNPRLTFARGSKRKHLELLFYNESNSHYYGQLSFGHFDYTTGRSVSGDEFIQGSQYANPTPRTTCAI